MLVIRKELSLHIELKHLKTNTMTTLEIINNFTKGNDVAIISEKQKAWLLGQAKKENVSLYNNNFSDTLYFDDCFYNVRHCKVFASGGSYVGSSIVHGKFRIEKMYTIRFTDTNITEACRDVDIKHYQKQGIGYEVIKPQILTR